MKKMVLVLVCLFSFCFALSPVWAGGDKVQNEHEQEKGDAENDEAPKPGSDAQGNQSH